MCDFISFEGGQARGRQSAVMSPEGRLLRPHFLEYVTAGNRAVPYDRGLMDSIPDSNDDVLGRKLQARARFLELYLADLQDGGLRSRSEYQEQFPGHEELVGKLHDEGLRDGSTEPEHASAPVRPDTGNHHHRSALDPGDELLGPYRILRELGRGGQGTVYLAEDTHLGRKVASRCSRICGPGSADTVRRFQREAEVAAKLHHPGICGVSRCGRRWRASPTSPCSTCRARRWPSAWPLHGRAAGSRSSPP